MFMDDSGTGRGRVGEMWGVTNRLQIKINCIRNLKERYKLGAVCRKYLIAVKPDPVP